jgi:hypothetical protein
MRLIITSLALLAVGALFGASLYDAVVLAPNLRGGPEGLEHGRLFMQRATPANLFRVAAPITQLLLLVAVIATWARPSCRWPLAGALLFLVANDVMTFAFHYPRLRLMFTAPMTVPADALESAAREWASANLLRVALVLAAWVCTWFATMKVAHGWRSWPIA